MTDILSDLAQRIKPLGLSVRGAFHPGTEDGAPDHTGTLALIGNLGPAMWDAFCRERPDGDDPLDRWTQDKLNPIAKGLNACAVFPFQGPPHFPFQRWAMKTEGLRQSPIGPLIHPEYGLWQAFRAAFVWKERLALPPMLRPSHPCDSCTAKPCLTSCPVQALTPGRYNVPACLDHMDSSQGAPCHEKGCLARSACPIGQAWAYGPAQHAFHIAAFRRAQGRLA